MSRDIEDIIAVLDGRPEIVDEVKHAEVELVKALSTRFRDMLHENRFVDAVSGHMPTDETSQARVAIVLNRMQQIAESQ